MPAKTVENLWTEHEQATFPDECRGPEYNGVDLVLLDAAIAGCVMTYVSRRALDARRLAILTDGVCALDSIIPQLGSEASAYFSRLRKLGEMVLASSGGAGRQA